jgi:bifunctional ADP-heptose synthase (sugar kinase/adenylyltransferase)
MLTTMTEKVLEQILEKIPSLTIGVLGDLFLDRYLDIDARLTEPSLETGLDAYQVVRVRSCPGAAGTVISNLAALGVGRIVPIAIIGDDGEGYELRRALGQLPAVTSDGIFSCPDRRTPTYTKPMLSAPDATPRELNRLDIKNWTMLPSAAEEQILSTLADVWPSLDGLIVLDQVSEPDCGVVTERVRRQLEEMGTKDSKRFILADSRERIELFRAVSLKPNASECCGAVIEADAPTAALALARTCGRPVFCTWGAKGILLAEPEQASADLIAGYPVTGPIDPVGAGDSTSAGIVCARACGASLHEAAAFGNLVASITIQQLGVTGTATPDQVRQRWREVRSE